MSASKKVPMTPTRLGWLQHLAKHGETGWSRMPVSNAPSGRRSCTNQTWRPMVAAGWIEAWFGQRDFRQSEEWRFKITEAGRAAIAAALESS